MKKIFGKEYYSTGEVAKMLSVSPATIRNAVKDGNLQTILVGRVLYCTMEDIQNSLNRGNSKAEAPTNK